MIARILAVGVAVAAGGLLLLGDIAVDAARISDIRNTKHNFSTSAPAENAVKSTTEDQVCVFCHTPHAATSGMKPLWNKQGSAASYTTYGSASLDAAALGLDQPGGSSKLCLSCHDGTIAIGQVNVLNGASTTISVGGTEPDGTIPGGGGADTGFTRRLGHDLSNDHPISFTYDDTLAGTDGELQAPSTSGGSPKLIDSRAIGYKPKFPLENGQLQCTTCHDPHIRETEAAEGNIKFLRLNRLQKQAPTGTFSESGDILCLACHTKAGWEKSAHADQTVANETFTDNAASIRDIPSGTQVWQAACLGCHDPHTVQGSRRLLREGTTGGANAQGLKAGGSPALEETCYQCHSATGTTTTGGVSGLVLTNQGSVGFTVPEIKSDFLSTYRMPIAESTEVHDIGDSPLAQAGKDFIEKPSLLNDRHVECTDCHNPHRVQKNKLFTGTGETTSGTHVHASGVAHSNLASGVLRGSWGVEPIYGSDVSNAFGNEPTGFTVKRGDPGSSVATDVNQPYVTREYQICLKCHSNYAYGAVPPSLGASEGSTLGWGYSDTGGGEQIMTYTNQAMEFQGPADDRGEPGGNHRSWHPVTTATGRTPAIRDTPANNWLAPFNAAVGTQTMYCSDCHGSNVSGSGTVVPDGNGSGEDGKPWGPHGSTNPFLLKAPWSGSTGTGRSNDLCFKCHSYSRYATRGGGSSGFGGSKDSNLHSYHADKIGRMRCGWCHVAVPHGWKNKALLVNLNDVGPEVGLPAGTQVRNKTTAAYNKAPYYMNAMNKVRNFATSGSWGENNCGSSGSPGNGESGRDWMRDSNENCENPP